MLIGLCGAELVSPNAVSASQGVLGLISYIGAANAGVPLAHFIGQYSWDGYFVVMAGASVATALLLAPLANAKSAVQKQREATLAGGNGSGS
jgi:OPA family sugar phosphate sensor protein UhpC-like MFS transporter